MGDYCYLFYGFMYKSYLAVRLGLAFCSVAKGDYAFILIINDKDNFKNMGLIVIVSPAGDITLTNYNIFELYSSNKWKLLT